MTLPTSHYEPRHFRYHGVRKSDGLDYKLYSIGCRAIGARAELVQQAEALAERELAAAAEAEGGHHGLGFVILHEGQVGTWLLLHWWAHEDILCQQMYRWDDSGAFAKTDRPLHGCVWEGVVITHEHKAWISHVLRGAPDAEAYLMDALPDGVY
jgi:hypothetical protein